MAEQPQKDKRKMLFLLGAVILVIMGLVYMLTISALNNKVDSLDRKLSTIGQAAELKDGVCSIACRCTRRVATTIGVQWESGILRFISGFSIRSRQL